VEYPGREKKKLSSGPKKASCRRVGETVVAQLGSALNQAEQFRDQQIQQQYCDQLGVYVQEKAQLQA
jgi:hypothetical protein